MQEQLNIVWHIYPTDNMCAFYLVHLPSWTTIGTVLLGS